MTDLPPLALEITTDDQVVPVEAPPCGHRLDIPDRNVHLRCDRPRGHSHQLKHRQVLRATPCWTASWCDGDCAAPCFAWKGLLKLLREQGIEIGTGWP